MKPIHLRLFSAAWTVILFISFVQATWWQTSSANFGADPSQTGLYLVQFDELAVASYRGDILGLAATSPSVTGAKRLDLHAPDTLSYRQYLQNRHADFLAAAERVIERPLKAHFEYLYALNGLAIQLSAAEAYQIQNLPGVRAITPDLIEQPDTDTGPLWVGAEAIWNGEPFTNTLAYQGEGMIIGVIDTGINHDHPSFTDLTADGYDHTNPYGSGVYVGWCVEHPDFCNDKLIGAYGLNPVGGDPEDNFSSGHGSHTASTAAGNQHEILIPGMALTTTIQGVAPHANLIAYKVCDPGCPHSSIIMAIDYAIQNGVDVLNFSISGNDNPWNDPVELAFLDAFEAGIFVAASADNTGPTPGTVAKTGAWLAAVGNTSPPRAFANLLEVFGAPVELSALYVFPGVNSQIFAAIEGEIKFHPSNLNGCSGFPAGYFTNAIALVQRGNCGFETKVSNAATAGALAVVVYNNIGGPPTQMSSLTGIIPAFMLSLADGEALHTYLTSTSPPVAVKLHYPTERIWKTVWGDMLHNTSARGPGQFDVLKPNLVAPGTSILAASKAPAEYTFLNGTSMAAPHVAGGAALLGGLHPDWSPAEILSALSSTAYDGQTLLREDEVTPADPFDRGAGRLDLARAAEAGFILNEARPNYRAANPDIGGDPKTLNLPALVDSACVYACQWQRTITSSVPFSVAWNVVFSSTQAISVTVEPASFILEAGASQVITFTSDVRGIPLDSYLFGDIRFTPTSPVAVSAAHFPVIIRPTFDNLPAVIHIQTDQRSASFTRHNFKALTDIIQLTAQVDGLARGEMIEAEIAQDPTRADPYNQDGGTVWLTITVPISATQLLIDIVESQAFDVDLFVGNGETPSASSVICRRSTQEWQESCTIDDPAPGVYWALAQNYNGSLSQPDRLRLAAGALIPGDAANLTVEDTGPVLAGALFDLVLHWDEPDMQGLDHWLGLVTLGSKPAGIGDLGSLWVKLDYEPPIRLDQQAPGSAHPGEVFTYTLSLDTYSSGWLTDTLPTGVEYVTNTLTATHGTTWYDPPTQAIYWQRYAPGGETLTAITITFQVSVTAPADSQIVNTVELTHQDELLTSTAITDIPPAATFVYHDLEDVVPPGGALHIAGNFNQWIANATPMTGDPGGNVFTATIATPSVPVELEYKYVLGDTWDGHAGDQLNAITRTLTITGNSLVHDYRLMPIEWVTLVTTQPLTTVIGEASPTITGEVFLNGVTNHAALTETQIVAEVGYSSPDHPEDWLWQPITPSVQTIAGSVRFSGALLLQTSGVFTYTVRFRYDGLHPMNPNQEEWMTAERAGTLTVLDRYTLETAVVGQGSILIEPAQVEFVAGELVTLSAIADPGWQFTGWSGDAHGSISPLVVSMEANTAITATFELLTADLAIQLEAPIQVPISDIITYTITVQNLGPEIAAGAILTDSLPGNAGLVWVEENCSLSDELLVCTLGDLAPGTTLTLSLAITIQGQSEWAFNQVTLTASTPDPDPTNNTADSQTRVVWRSTYLPIVIR